MKRKYLLFITKLTAAIKVMQAERYLIATVDKGSDKTNIAHSELDVNTIRTLSNYLIIKVQLEALKN